MVLEEMQIETNRLDRIEEILEQFAKEMLELKAAQAKTDLQIKETAIRIKKTDENIGRLTGGWGKFVEGMAEPAVIKLAKDMGMKIKNIHRYVEGYKIDEKREIDLMVVGEFNGRCTVLAVEAKSSFESNDAKYFLEVLEDFYGYFSEYKDGKYQVIGVVASPRFGDGVDLSLLKKGLFILKPSDGIMQVIEPGRLKIYPKETMHKGVKISKIE